MSKQRKTCYCLTAGLVCMGLLWLCVLCQTGAKLDYREDQTGGFVALRLAPQAGVSWE